MVAGAHTVGYIVVGCTHVRYRHIGGHKAGTVQYQLLVVAREAFGKPEGSAVVFFLIIEGAKVFRLYALHIPDVEIFVRQKRKEPKELVTIIGEIHSGLQHRACTMLQATATLRGLVDNE